MSWAPAKRFMSTALLRPRGWKGEPGGVGHRTRAELAPPQQIWEEELLGANVGKERPIDIEHRCNRAHATRGKESSKASGRAPAGAPLEASGDSWRQDLFASVIKDHEAAQQAEADHEVDEDEISDRQGGEAPPLSERGGAVGSLEGELDEHRAEDGRLGE